MSLFFKTTLTVCCFILSLQALCCPRRFVTYWTQPADIKEKYRNASILKNRRVVFNIRGNDYRLIASVAYRYGAVYIKFIGTHAEYDAIDAETVELEP